jgi:hypothetical protein
MQFSRPKVRKFPVFFPVSREFSRRKVSARLRAPPASLNCREFPLVLSRNVRIMPVFRDYSQANRTSVNGLLVGEGVTVRPFLQRAHAQSGFKEGYRANVKRSESISARYSLRRHSVGTGEPHSCIPLIRRGDFRNVMNPHSSSHRMQVRDRFVLNGLDHFPLACGRVDI